MDIERVTPRDLEAKLRELAHATNKSNTAYTELREKYAVLDDNKKTVFASLCDVQDCKTQVEKERKALLSNEWMNYIKDYQEARSLMRIAENKRDNLQRLWESCRSILSSKNTERRTVT